MISLRIFRITKQQTNMYTSISELLKTKNMLTQAHAQKESLAQKLKQLDKEWLDVFNEQKENEKNVEELTMTLGNLYYNLPPRPARVAPAVRPFGVPSAAALAPAAERSPEETRSTSEAAAHPAHNFGDANPLSPPVVFGAPAVFGHDFYFGKAPPAVRPFGVPPVAPPPKKRQRVDTPDEDNQ